MNRRLRHFSVGLLLLITPRIGAQNQTSAAANRAGRGLVSLPDKTWGVELDLPGFTINFSGMKTDGRRYFVASNRRSSVEVSVTLEEVTTGRAPMTCKEMMKSRVGDSPENIASYASTEIEPKKIRTWEDGDKTYMEYLIPRLKDPGQKPVDINEENRFLCFQHEDVFVDIHVSKPNFQPGEEKLFDPIFDSAQIREGLTRTSVDYFAVGTSFYDEGAFKRAIPLYSQSLALEQQEPKLDKKLWYVLVDNLGMAYAVTGDLEDARKTFDYGIQKDPDYPMFYYEMADYYGEKGDLQDTLAFLQKAWDRRDNLLPGEKFPDPGKDDSFKRFYKNPDFKKLAETLNTPMLTHRPTN